MGDEATQDKPTMNKAFALWEGRGKVAFQGFIQEDLTIPAGAKVLAFRNTDATSSNRQPHLRFVWLVETKNE